MQANSDRLDRAVVGALRSAIHDHGAITPERIGSAAKRVRGAIDGAVGAAAMARKRWEGTTVEQRREFASCGGRSAWAGMTKEQRSAEMKRRATQRRAQQRAREVALAT